jgi:hypothetical protein
MAAACTGSGRIPDRPVPLTDPVRSTSNHPPSTMRDMGTGWTQPPLDDGLGPVEVDTRGRIAQLREAGHGWARVAELLNAEGIATPSGRGRWHKSTVEHYANPERWAQEQARRRARRA